MTEDKPNYFIFDDGMIHLANDGIRACTGEPESREKFDGEYEFYQLCQKCQGKKRQ